MSKLIKFVVAACLLGQVAPCFCDMAYMTGAGAAALEAPVAACPSGCCHSKQKPAEDSPGNCNWLGCAGVTQSAEAVNTSSPVPELRSAPACYPDARLAAATLAGRIPCTEATVRSPGRPVYLLFEVLLT